MLSEERRQRKMWHSIDNNREATEKLRTTIEPLLIKGKDSRLKTVIVTRTCGHKDKLIATEGAADRVGSEAANTPCIRCHNAAMIARADDPEQVGLRRE